MKGEHGCLDEFIKECLDSGRYLVEDSGRIWCLDYRGFGITRPVVTFKGAGGYSKCALSLWVNGRMLRKAQVYHNRLMAIRFLGMPRHKAMDAEHKDANRMNCALSNIEWLDKPENSRRANERARRRTTGKVLGGEGMQGPAAKLDDDAARDAHREFANGESMGSIARRLGVCKPTIHDVVRGVSWRHIYREFHPE